MATWGEFSSLLQLGVGLGLGLSVFMAPIELRLRRLRSELSGEISSLEKNQSEQARRKRRDYLDLSDEFEVQAEKVSKILKPLVAFLLILAVYNAVMLIIGSLRAGEDLPAFGEIILISTSLGLYFFMIVLFEVIAQRKLVFFLRRFEKIRNSI